ncbi:GNAT family N-acetyltransferase [Spirosoma knui]
MQYHYSTQRLSLDLVNESDHAFVLTMLNSKGWLQFIGDRNVRSTEDSIAYIKRIENTPNFYYWVVRLKDRNTSIGIVSFMKRSYLEHFDIGFALLPEFMGLGYAYEAAERVLSAAKMHYSPILATVVPQNSSSIRLLTRLGFQFAKEIDVETLKLHVYSNT